MDTKIDVCRICLLNQSSVIELFSDNEESKDILNNIYLCFQIILSFEDYLPRVICTSCLMELNMANKFRLKCISFEQRFSASLYKTKLNYDSDDAAANYTGSPDVPENTQLDKDQEIETSKIKLEKSETDLNDDESKNAAANYTGSPDVPEKTQLDIEQVIETSKIKPEKSETKCYKINNQCKILKKILTTDNSLLKHTTNMHKKRKHVGKVTGFGSERRYNCTECKYTTPYSQSLVNHMRIHNGDRPYKCECGKTFTQTSSLSAHKKTHSATTYYTCTTCGRQFKHLCSLKKHRSVHNPEDFSCSICSKVLKSRLTLRDHMLRHSNVKNFNCEDCGDTFVTSSELIHHKKKHATNKTIECHLCDYKTNDKIYFNLHLKRHCGERPYECELCHFTCYTKVEVGRHMRVHTKVKPYCCPTCGQKFAHSTSVNKHMLTVHGLLHKWQDLKSNDNRQKIDPPSSL